MSQTIADTSLSLGLLDPTLGGRVGYSPLLEGVHHTRENLKTTHGEGSVGWSRAD